ncbi:Glycine--tRNA ligase [Mycoplasmopsis arginini]|nr:Glycine--tRNA ligase [Chlamydia abortus]SGA04862.1 Glycine--tRNA ligase [Mycoplasmopsis arginini]SGA20895.1 Glycine--tRNA ligase [Mycoplasmopsis arginini]SGA31359.1 Glycine--tRNA ligase [Chlamydia abortus]
MKFSGESLEYLKEDGTKIIPFVIEPSIGLDRLLFALIIDAFDIEKLDNQEERVVLHLDQKISPYQIAILPLMKKQSDEAKKIFEDLIENTNLRVTYDESGSIGKRYRRQDAIGTPFCVTIDFDTVEHNTVTIRNRDTMKQDTILVSDIAKYLEDQKK